MAHQLIKFVRPFSTKYIHPKMPIYDDFKAALDVPETKEERAAAAKKYNLLPEEYEPASIDKISVGDYPELADDYFHHRPAHYPWDDPYHRRNFGEPLPINFPAQEATDDTPPRYSATAALSFWGMILLIMIGTYKFRFLHLMAGPDQIPQHHFVEFGEKYFWFESLPEEK